MLLYVIIAVCLIVGMYNSFTDKSLQREGFGVKIALGLVMSILCGMLGLFLFAVTARIIINESKPIYEFRDRYQITSIRSADTAHGTFSLGFGTIDGKLKYVVTRPLGDNRYCQDYVDADITTLVESNEVPSVITYSSRISNKWIAPGNLYYNDTTSHEIIVPPGTIVQRFNIE